MNIIEKFNILSASIIFNKIQTNKISQKNQEIELQFRIEPDILDVIVYVVVCYIIVTCQTICSLESIKRGHV